MAVIDDYQYRVDDPKMKARNPDIKDFKKLNKVVLAEGATNSMVRSRSYFIYQFFK